MILFQTLRLKIRYFHSSDTSAFHAYRSLESVARFQGYEPMSFVECEEFITSQLDAQLNHDAAWIQLAVEMIESKQLIGDFGLCMSDQIAEVGFSFHPDFQGKGFATEAFRGMIDFLFAKEGIRRLVETVDERNLACIRLLERCGLTKEGHFRENIFLKGEWCSEMQYALLRSDWEQQKSLQS
ncbi:MAG: GNAT family N-acetyltransferase [Crocinitomicaceae bacterium]|nr:GNAT family N-acetyltransferase [Crocinitomicaceae bacterium]